MKNTAKVVLEGPRGEEQTVENVKSITTDEGGEIHIDIEGEPELASFGWDWTIRDVYVSYSPEVSEGDWVTYTFENSIQRGKVLEDRGEEIVVKQLPDGFQVSIHEDQIIPA